MDMNATTPLPPPPHFPIPQANEIHPNPPHGDTHLPLADGEDELHSAKMDDIDDGHDALNM
jgi:hypothetical protein